MPDIHTDPPQDNSHFQVTFFSDVHAVRKDVEIIGLEDLAARISAAEADSKDGLPLFALIDFGAKLSKKGSIRWDGNVLGITGVVADYDGETMAVEEAADRIRKAGLEAILYTTPTHKPDKPRWRCVCPFATRLGPEVHRQMMARLNGVFGGILADDSFSLSRSYFYGHARNNEFSGHGIVFHGARIESCDELDEGAIGKGSHSTGHGGNGYDFSGDTTAIEELARRIISGESLHPSCVSIGAKYSARGWPFDSAIEVVGMAFTLAKVDRYDGRWSECVEAVQWAYDKDAETKTEAAGKTIVLPWMNLALDSTPVPEQAWTVDHRIPANQACLLSGHGGAGKSLIGLYLCAAHVMGKDWLKSMPAPGPAWFIDAEDATPVIHYRLDSIRKHMGVTYQDLIDNGLRALPMAGEDTVMAVIDRNGKVVPTPFYHALLEQAGDEKPVQIVIASAANVFAGNENDRVQVQQFVGLLTKIAICTGGSVTLISHPSLTGLATGSGISGTTQWHNAFRARMVLNGVTDDTELRKLDFLKNQYGPLGESIALRWQKGMFLPDPELADYEKAAAAAKADHVFLALLRRYEDSGTKLTSNKTAKGYAPNQFSKEPEAIMAKLNKLALEHAMHRLIERKTLEIVWEGPPSQRVPRLKMTTS